MLIFVLLFVHFSFCHAIEIWWYRKYSHSSVKFICLPHQKLCKMKRLRRELTKWKSRFDIGFLWIHFGTKSRRNWLNFFFLDQAKHSSYGHFWFEPHFDESLLDKKKHLTKISVWIVINLPSKINASCFPTLQNWVELKILPLLITHKCKQEKLCYSII